MSSRQIGRVAEDLALAHLCNEGLRLVQRNFCCRGGELDLVMRDGETLVFVEVRSRRGNRYGSAEESVTATKQARLRKAAAFYLLRHPDWSNSCCRFDVIAVTQNSKDPRINWIPNAFDTN